MEKNLKKNRKQSESLCTLEIKTALYITVLQLKKKKDLATSTADSTREPCVNFEEPCPQG